MRVVVCGGGYAGVTAVHRLERELPESVEIVLIDRDEVHLIQHELHRVVRHPELAQTITIPFREIVDRADVVTAAIESIDPEAGVVTLESSERIDYDVGLLALGGETAHYDLPGVHKHGIPLKRIEHAKRIREAVLSAASNRDESDTTREDSKSASNSRAGSDTKRKSGTRPRVVVGGAGLSGVQVAGEIAMLEPEPRVHVLEQASVVTPSFPPPFQRAVHRTLLDRNIRVRTDVAITEAGPTSIRVEDGTTIPYDVFVWTGGITGPAAIGGERPAVRSDLRLTTSTFVAGDMASIIDDHGTRVPATAQAAVQTAATASRNVAHTVRHRQDHPSGFGPKLDRFTFEPSGWIVSIGDGTVAQVGSTVVTGPPALALKATVGVRYLTSVGAVRDALRLVRGELDLVRSTGT